MNGLGTFLTILAPNRPMVSFKRALGDRRYPLNKHCDEFDFGYSIVEFIAVRFSQMCVFISCDLIMRN